MKQVIMAALLLPALMGCGNEPAQEEQEGMEATEAPATPAKVDVPEAVSQAFAKQFPTCTDVVWEMARSTRPNSRRTAIHIRRATKPMVAGSRPKHR